MRKLYVCAALAALVSSGCCRMCCWQRGGSWYNGYCYPQMPPAMQQPALQQVPQQPPRSYYAPPTYAQPCLCQ